MKAWCFWMSLTLCCMTLMPLFVARSLLLGSTPASLPMHRRGASRHAR